MIRTDDPDDLTEQMRLVAPGCRIQAVHGARFYADARLARLTQVALFRVGLSNGRALIEEHDDYLGVTAPLDAPVGIVDKGDLLTFEPGSAHVLNHDVPFDLRSPDKVSMLAMNFFGPLLERTAGKLNGGEDSEIRGLPSCVSLETHRGSAYWRFASFLWGEVDRGAAFLDSPIMTRTYEDTLAAGLLFALDGQRHSLLRPAEDACSPVYVRRAEHFLFANLTEPISLADVAEATEVNVRTLTRAFKKAHGKGPMAFLKERRLHRAHLDLLGADPQRATVTEIAMTYQFHQLSRFAGVYKETFQEHPSKTLRRR